MKWERGKEKNGTGFILIIISVLLLMSVLTTGASVSLEGPISERSHIAFWSERLYPDHHCHFGVCASTGVCIRTITRWYVG